jgi:hypothetical protein
VSIRQVINHSKKRVGIVTYTFFAVFVIGVLVSISGRAFFPLAIAGFVGFMGGTLYLLWGIRCPNCRGSLGMVTAYQSGPFAISNRVRFCPFCGVSLDAESGKIEVEPAAGGNAG